MTDSKFTDEQIIKVTTYVLDEKIKEQEGMLGMMELTNDMLNVMKKSNDGKLPDDVVEKMPSDDIEGDIVRVRLAVDMMKAMKNAKAVEKSPKSAMMFLRSEKKTDADIEEILLKLQVDQIEA